MRLEQINDTPSRVGGRNGKLFEKGFQKEYPQNELLLWTKLPR